MLLMSGHEVLGHGTACVTLGGEAQAVDAMYFDCSEITPEWKDQLYRGAGSLFNVLLALACVLGLRRLAQPRSWLGYFLWISAILNLLQSGSYVGFGRFIHPGMDWAMIVAASEPASVWAPLVTLAGIALIVWGLQVGRAGEALFLAPGASVRRQRTRLLMPPYLTAAAISIAASALVPSDDRMMMIMGGIGNSLFFLAPMLLLLAFPARRGAPEQGPDLPPRRWIVGAALVATVLYLVLAGGIDLG